MKYAFILAALATLLVAGCDGLNIDLSRTNGNQKAPETTDTVE